MFSTYRHRLLFWFLIFISTNLVTVWLSLRYLQFRSDIEATTQQLKDANTLILKWANQQQNHFSYDTRSDHYFQARQSAFLANYDELRKQLLDALHRTKGRLASASFDSLIFKVHQTDTVFKKLIKLLLERGYKNYGVEGVMRQEAHWLESKSGRQAEDILSLRRHEKDYIIRNSGEYVSRLNALCDNLTRKSTDSVRLHLARYQNYFNRLVELDRLTGIKDNTALKANLDKNRNQLEQLLSQLMLRAEVAARRELRTLNYLFGSIVLILFFAGVIASYVIATRLTKPLKELTLFITRFVDSNFTVEEDPSIKTRDEVGKLTRNFTVMKNEVITRLKFFKQKVDERTAELATANRKLMQLNEAHKRFVPQEFLKLLNKPSIEAVQLGDQIEQEMTVMFTDIRSFTQLSEQLSPQENFDFINAYLNKVVPAIEKHGGFIDKYIGDSVMALFADSPAAAIRAALELNRGVDMFNAEWQAKGNEPISVGIGIHTGKLILGTIGHDKRIQTTVISDAVNIASRIEGLTKQYQTKILITDATLRLLAAQQWSYRFIDQVKVKGKSNALAVFEILDESEPEKIASKPEFESALELLRQKHVAQAQAILTRLQANNPTDLTLQVFLSRCAEFVKRGLPEEWDGTEVMQSK